MSYIHKIKVDIFVEKASVGFFVVPKCVIMSLRKKFYLRRWKFELYQIG
nr:MAG TPA: hypothetical protein [Caudoviricetes sp.]